MMHSCNHSLESPQDFVQILHGNIAFIELSLLNVDLYQTPDQAANLTGIGVLQGSSGSLHLIGQHQYGRFLSLWLGSGIAEVIFVDLSVFTVCGVSSLLIKVLHQPCAMVLGNQVTDLGNQLDLVGKGQTILHVAGQDQAGHTG